MPNLRSRIAVPSGILIALTISLIIYYLDLPTVHSIVFTSYAGFIDPNQLYEVAWLLATIDNLLNLANPLSLIIWCTIIIGTSLAIHNMNSSLKLIGTAIIFPGATWLLFTFKYAAQAGMSLLTIECFFLWRLIIPLVLGLSATGLISIPFWISSHRKPTVTETPIAIQFICQECGAQYRSNPTVCVQCGSEGRIRNTKETA